MKFPKTLLDSGVTGLRNIGDQALLDLTLKKYPGATVLKADFPLHKKYRWNPRNWLHYLQAIVKANHIHIVSGGLFKNSGKIYVLRKYLTVFLAKTLRKKISVGTQTFCLKGHLRILFKMLFRNIKVPTRDHYSLKDLQDLKIESVFEEDLTIYRNRKHESNPIILIDSRLLSKFKIKVVPTMHTDKTWVELEKAVQEAKFVLSNSFHLAILASNNRVPCVVVYNSEYYRRKLSELKNIVEVNLNEYLPMD